MPKVIHTAYRKDGKPKKVSLQMWIPEKARVYVILGHYGLYYNPSHPKRWTHRPKLYLKRADAIKAIALHNLGKVVIQEFALSQVGYHRAESVPSGTYGKHIGKIIHEQTNPTGSLSPQGN